MNTQNKCYLDKDECRKIEINILRVIDELCKENNLKYFICGGTLLGAVRHHGFIPWDDDVDIMLLRNDYEKLLNVLKTQKKYKWLKILDSSCSDYYYTFAKAIDDRTVAKMDDNRTRHGLWVDIFPYDNLPDDKKQREKFIMKGYYYRSIVMSMTTDFKAKKINKKGIKLLLNIYSKFINKKKFILKYEKFSKKYSGDDTKYVGCLFTPYKLRECFERSWFDHQTKLIFENENFSAPGDYEKYLSQLYGDYMKLPPKDKQKNHQIIAWKK